MSASDAPADAAPAFKKPKTSQADGAGTTSDAEESSSLSKSQCLKDCGRSGRLTLRVNDIYRLVGDDGDARGEWVLVSGINWRLWAYFEDGYFCCYVESAGVDNDNWHSKAKYWVRLRNPTTGRHETKEGFALFDNSLDNWGYRWMKTEELLIEENGYVINDGIDLDCDLTTFSCYVTDGAYGDRTRFHDVSFKFYDDYIYANKGFLAANSDFFEAMFYGEFGDKHKDEVTLTDIEAEDFACFLIAISPSPPAIQDNKEIELLRLASRFQSGTLTERCCKLLLADEIVCEAHSLVSRLEVADELQLVHFRDSLVARATHEEISEAAQEENEKRFSGTTWFKLLLNYKSLKG
ncbi:Protein BATH-9 [Aphelenchoides avenae]|nr:Protein BATH-9 [Aphelenchus avenae]